MPAKLHVERIEGDGASARGVFALTHGFFGSGMNWRGIARKVVARRPEWTIALVDLREHGKSPAGEPPHSLRACAEDLRATADDVGAIVVGGHSFGGKTSLLARTLADARLRQTWVFDASPSVRPDALGDPNNQVGQVLQLMMRLPRTWANRDDFVGALVAGGQSASLAQWLAMSLVADPARAGSLVLRFDFAALREMLADYCAQDAWPALLAPTPGEVRIVVADRSDTINAADRARLAHAPPHVRVHHVDAGHWLHIEAAEAVVELLARELPAVG